MSYSKTNWLNDQSPALEADNLNKMETGIYDADVKAEQAKAGNPSAADTQKLVNITVSNPIDLDTSVLNTGATMTGALKVKTPVDDMDAATKKYIDDKLAALTSSIGYMSVLTTPSYDITTTPMNIVGYTNDGSVFTTVDKALGTITVDRAGVYRFSATVDINFATDHQAREMYIEFYNITTSTVLYKYTIPIAKDTTQTAASFNIPHAVDANEEVVLRVTGGEDFTVDLNSMSFDVESVHIR